MQVLGSTTLAFLRAGLVGINAIPSPLHGNKGSAMLPVARAASGPCSQPLAPLSGMVNASTTFVMIHHRGRTGQ